MAEAQFRAVKLAFQSCAGRMGALGAALFACLSACAPAGLFDYEVSESARAADWPSLYSGGPPIEVVPADEDLAVDLSEASESLAARAAALRRRAAAMRGPLLTADDPARVAFEN